ncbi:cupin domain-containing protein [Amycolatopsis regifaucium]|uniref:Cupin n=1 Tax=Amycolatopsis regifaucium TaxID=546365 RepID=A0A154MNC4_9PSEU|nr:cupin domain-containing protein [Amycolatopsis regifaucium]KZB85781.1 cupin [Amycolatopsis regifaucium]OKA10463.1 cupin [Amycolatopsis regifaucium]SFI78165.1 Mannose-6-phosphate isomerase, cupin superfamily [Amycolatopsis regifaucium]
MSDDALETVEGRDIGSGISIIRERTDVEGSGPRLHRHPYGETFVILRGRARFTIGAAEREGGAGEVLVVPADTPHKFAVIGPEVYEAVHIHESDHFITEWLE